MQIEKIQFSPAYRVVADDLRQRILRGEVQPGEALPIETELAQKYGVHRSTMREGLRHLEQDGLLRREGKKLIVSIPSHGELATAAERALRMRRVSYRDVWELTMALEPLCARLAAERITEDELQRLDRNIEATAASVEAGQAPVALTIEFQNLVAEATHNEALLLARGPVSLLMRAGYETIAPALPQSGRRLLQAHSHVVEAMRRHEVEAAVDWTLKHLRDHRRGFDVAGIDVDAPIGEILVSV